MRPTDTTKIEALVALVRHCHAHGWAFATGGNFSARLDEERIAITASGRDKGQLSVDDIGLVDVTGAPLTEGFRPSAETPLHCALYRWSAQVGAVAHTHSVAATVLSRRNAGRGAVAIRGYEMAKALAGVVTHETEVILPVLPATQDMSALARAAEARLAPGVYGYLVEGHGLTTWGEDIDIARRHVEALEFLLACALHEGG